MAGINFDFTTGVLPPEITFTRASIGSYIDNAGILQVAGSDVPRFSYVGGGAACLLIEPAATNLLAQSNDFTAFGVWQIQSNGTLTPAQFPAPDGTNNGWAFGNGTGGGWLLYLPLTTYSNIPYTISLWVAQISGPATAMALDVDSVIKNVTTSRNLTRWSATSTPPAGPDSAGFRYVTSDTTSVSCIYGAQMEVGPVMTSYIPTTTAPASRAADVATFTIPAGVNALRYTFDDGSTQIVSVVPGSYTIPANLRRANIRSIQSLWAFDFTSGSLPAGVTFTRASSGTYLDSAGILQTAANHVARFQTLGGSPCLLIEPAATNLLLDSNNFSSANWTLTNSAVLTPNQFATPDGGNNGWSLTSGVGNGGVQQAGFVYANTSYAISFWDIRIVAVASMRATINATNSGTIACTAVLNRNFALAVPAAGAASAVIFVNVAAAGSTNGIFGAQLELGLVPTSYIPTTSGPGTRAADIATFTIPANINQLVYTFDDGSTQTLTVSSGIYTIPTNLARLNIRTIVGVPFQGFDFTTGSLPAGITFTRASSATYLDSVGNLLTVGNDVPRFQFAGGTPCLLIEPAVTNLLVQSNGFGAAPWIKVQGATATSAQFVSPDGTNDGWSLTSTTVAGQTGGCADPVTFANIPYTMSVWAKFITGTAPIKFQLYTIASGSIPTSATMTRYAATMTPPAISGQYANVVMNVTTVGSLNGIFGAQLETGSLMTSYIPTGATTVTRAADVATFTIPAGVTMLNYTFDDDTCQTVPVTPGSYTIPNNLARLHIATIAFLSPLISIQGIASATATSVAIPAHQPGDAIFVVARNNAGVIPVIPAAGGTVPDWITLQAGSVAVPTMRASYAIATDVNHTTGVWTSLTEICVMVLRPSAGFQLQIRTGTGQSNATSGTITYPALTLVKANGTSWGLRCGSRQTAVAAVATPPSGWANAIAHPAGATCVMAVHTLMGISANPVADVVTVSGVNALSRGYTIEVVVGNYNPMVAIV